MCDLMLLVDKHYVRFSCPGSCEEAVSLLRSRGGQVLVNPGMLASEQTAVI